jgi:hypothetical protein
MKRKKAKEWNKMKKKRKNERRRTEKCLNKERRTNRRFQTAKMCLATQRIASVLS